MSQWVSRMNKVQSFAAIWQRSLLAGLQAARAGRVNVVFPRYKIFSSVTVELELWHVSTFNVQG